MAASNGMRDYFIYFLDGQNGDDGFCSLVCSCIDGTERDLERWIAKFFYDEIAQSLTLDIHGLIAFREAFVRPFLSKSMQSTGKSKVAGYVARLVMWWLYQVALSQKQEFKQDMQDDLASIAIDGIMYEHKGKAYRSFRAALGKKYATKTSEGGHQKGFMLMLILKQATSCDNSGGCDALFELASFLMKSSRFTTDALQRDRSDILKKVLDLYFDPLVIIKVTDERDMSLDTSSMMGREEFVNQYSEMIRVTWSDKRSDYLFAGIRQDRKSSRKTVEDILQQLLSSVSIDERSKKSLNDLITNVDLNHMSSPHDAPRKFATLLEHCIISISNQVRDKHPRQRRPHLPSDTPTLSAPPPPPCPSPQGKHKLFLFGLSIKIVIKAISWAIMYTDKEGEQSIFVLKLLKISMDFPSWWAEVMARKNADDLLTKLQRYFLLMRRDVGVHVLKHIYGCVDSIDKGSPAPAEMLGEVTGLSAWKLFLCEAVKAAEANSYFEQLRKQSKPFWAFLAHNYSLMGGEVSVAIATLGSRTHENVLSHLFVLFKAMGEDNDRHGHLKFCNSMFLPNLCDIWNKHLTYPQETKTNEDLKCADGLNASECRPGKMCWLRNLSSSGIKYGLMKIARHYEI
jgi:hypothetical protein